MKTFWKTIKRFLSDKLTSRHKMTLIDKKEITEGDYRDVFFVNYTLLCLNSCQNTSAVFAKLQYAVLPVNHA